ncbi:hypothetical protein [Candidatus Palauibacter sp.]|uniref:hypothetical protein n=1 Tax=Candidatus Palauibacter sp. TaxID=3101350 RepID=UPI003B599621
MVRFEVRRSVAASLLTTTTGVEGQRLMEIDGDELTAPARSSQYPAAKRNVSETAQIAVSNEQKKANSGRLTTVYPVRCSGEPRLAPCSGVAI